MNDRLDKFTLGFGVSAAITILFNTVLMILKEELPSVHTFMVTLSGHHWISHGILDLLVFVLLGVFLSKKEINKKLSSMLIVSTILSAFAIMLFIGFN